MPSTRFVPYEMKTSCIRIFEYDGKELSGVLENPYFKQPLYFKNLMTLLLLLDELYEQLNFPQKTMENRSFTALPDAPLPHETPPDGIPSKPLACFKLSVFFRQNASWQGNLVWTDKNTEAQFRSVLELIKLLDEALSL